MLIGLPLPADPVIGFPATALVGETQVRPGPNPDVRSRQEDTVGLSNVWVQTLGDGLIRADQITGIDAHQTPGVRGAPSRWLLDVVVSTPVGSGTREGWSVTALHRTLIQTAADPGTAPTALARLLAQLDAISAAGVIAVDRDESGTSASGQSAASFSAGGVRFRFVPFQSPAPGHHTDAEYL